MLTNGIGKMTDLNTYFDLVSGQSKFPEIAVSVEALKSLRYLWSQF